MAVLQEKDKSLNSWQITSEVELNYALDTIGVVRKDQHFFLLRECCIQKSALL